MKDSIGELSCPRFPNVLALLDPLLLRYTHLLKDMEREEAVIRGWEPNQVSHIKDI